MKYFIQSIFIFTSCIAISCSEKENSPESRAEEVKPPNTSTQLDQERLDKAVEQAVSDALANKQPAVKESVPNKPIAKNPPATPIPKEKTYTEAEVQKLINQAVKQKLNNNQTLSAREIKEQVKQELAKQINIPKAILVAPDTAKNLPNQESDSQIKKNNTHPVKDPQKETTNENTAQVPPKIVSPEKATPEKTEIIKEEQKSDHQRAIEIELNQLLQRYSK